MPFGLGDIHDETVAAYKDAIRGKDATIDDLRAENARLRGTKTRVREAELTSEVERLRAELAEVRASCDKAMDEQHAKLVRVADEKRAANGLLERLGKSIWQTSDLALPHDVKVHNLAAQPATAQTVATCDSCKRNRCDCYERDCDKCHWPGSPNCRRAGLKP